MRRDLLDRGDALDHLFAHVGNTHALGDILQDLGRFARFDLREYQGDDLGMLVFDDVGHHLSVELFELLEDLLALLLVESLIQKLLEHILGQRLFEDALEMVGSDLERRDGAQILIGIIEHLFEGLFGGGLEGEDRLYQLFDLVLFEPFEDLDGHLFGQGRYQNRRFLDAAEIAAALLFRQISPFGLIYLILLFFD